jgi:hypothetical protein
MAQTSVAEIPAGWYADPLGLPQRRWWDSSGWTQHVAPEHTSEARPEAAEQRSYSQQGTAQRGRGEYASVTPISRGVATLTAIRPTEADAAPASSTPLDQAAATAARDTATTSPHAYIPMSVNTPVQFRQPEGPRSSSSVAVWMIASMPVIQFAAVLGLVFVLADFGPFMQAAVAFIFFLWTAVLASRDKHHLLLSGHRKAATPWWLLLTPLAYLIARTACIRKQGGHGSAPMWVYVLLSTIPVIFAISAFIAADVMSLVLAAAR